MSTGLYPETADCINSAIVKLSKLTLASKVYRGVHDFTLPEQFWTANKFGVKGGIDGAFMSTTLNRDVAMDYAVGEGGAGFVFEIQQGALPWIESQGAKALPLTRRAARSQA